MNYCWIYCWDLVGLFEKLGMLRILEEFGYYSDGISVC